MTNVEMKIKEQMHQEFVVKKLIEKTIREIQSYVRSRTEDRHFADSWEQSAQISNDIERQEEKIEFLNTIKKQITCGMKISAKEMTRCKIIIFHPCW